MRLVTGFQLIRLLEKDGWVSKHKARHGQLMHKWFPEEGRARVTVVPRTRAVLPTGTLAAILGEKQTGLGAQGLVRLITQWGV